MFRQKFMQFVLCLLVICSPVIVFAQDNSGEPQEVFKFAFITGAYFGETEYKGEKLYQDEWMKQAQQVIDSKGVDFIIFGGDLIFNSRNANNVVDDSLYDLFNASIVTTKPIYYVPGDYELGSTPMNINQSSIDIWIKKGFTGPSPTEYYGFVHKNAAFYFLNTFAQRSLDPKVQERFDDQLADMDNFFTKYEDSPIKIVVGHLPPFVAEMDEDNQSSNIEKPYRAKLLQIMTKHKIRYYLASQRHTDEIVQEKGLVIFSNSQLSYRFGDGERRGFYIFVVCDQGMKRDFYPLQDESETDKYKG